jgi:hypothetical protein
MFVEGLLYGLMRVGDAVTFACLRRAACCLLCLRCDSGGGGCRLIGVTAGGTESNAIYRKDETRLSLKTRLKKS